MKIIAFISELDATAKSNWLAILQKQLPNEIVCLPEQINDAQAKTVDVAIVANPDPKQLEQFPNLVWIHSVWAGVEKLLDSTLSTSIKLVRLIDPIMSQSMAESVLAWTLYLQRNMAEYGRQQQNRQWQQLPSIASGDLRVSVLGVGELGLAALQILGHLDYQLACWSRKPKQLAGIQHYSGHTELKVLLAKTDILISLLPLTAKTHHLLDETLLSELPQGAKIINFSRGAVIDTNALIKLLNNDHLAHAVLDVFEQEPLLENDPLWQHPKVTVLPHISAPTDLNSAASIVAENITRYRQSNIVPDCVDRKVGY